MNDSHALAVRRSLIRQCLTTGVDFEHVRQEEERRRDALSRLETFKQEHGEDME